MADEKEKTVDWLQLPEPITSQIVSKLTCFTDRLRFSSVCAKWQSLLLPYDNGVDDYCPQLPPQLPLLLIPISSSSQLLPLPLPRLRPRPSSQLLPPLPPRHNADDKKNKKRNKNKNNGNVTTTTKSFTFYRFTDRKTYNQLQLTMPGERFCRGSGHGWLITVDQDDPRYQLDGPPCYPVQLINPFPSPFPKKIKLPLLATLPPCNKKGVKDPISCNFHLRRAVLSADPIANPRNYTVMVIYGGYRRLAFFKPGGKKVWTPINDDNDPEGLFADITYYKGKFYAVDYKGAVVECDLVTRTTTTVAGPPIWNEFRTKKYLVESLGELLQVHRHVELKDDGSHSTDEFQVFKLLPLDPNREKRKEPATDWVEVKDLCDRALFIGDNASISISASHFPGCKPNRIYFTDDYVNRYFNMQDCDPHDKNRYFKIEPQCDSHDVGAYFLEDKSFEKHYMDDFACILPAPIWIEPTLKPRKISLSS